MLSLFQWWPGEFHRKPHQLLIAKYSNYLYQNMSNPWGTPSYRGACTGTPGYPYCPSWWLHISTSLLPCTLSHMVHIVVTDTSEIIRFSFHFCSCNFAIKFSLYCNVMLSSVRGTSITDGANIYLKGWQRRVEISQPTIAVCWWTWLSRIGCFIVLDETLTKSFLAMNSPFPHFATHCCRHTNCWLWLWPRI